MNHEQANKRKAEDLDEFIDEIPLCGCGCGKPSDLADRTARPNPNSTARRLKYIRGHQPAQTVFRSFDPPDWIPTSEIRPILGRWLENEENTKETLSVRMGVPARTIWMWENGLTKYMSLDNVDKMLCAIDELHHFYSTLSEYYFAGLEDQVAA